MADEGWKPDPEVTRRAMEQIEYLQRNLPVCPCGQRTSNPSGICSKTGKDHASKVAEAKWS